MARGRWAACILSFEQLQFRSAGCGYICGCDPLEPRAPSQAELRYSAVIANQRCEQEMPKSAGAVGPAQIRVIDPVERLCPERNSVAFVQLECLEQAEVPVRTPAGKIPVPPGNSSLLDYLMRLRRRARLFLWGYL